MEWEKSEVKSGRERARDEKGVVRGFGGSDCQTVGRLSLCTVQLEWGW